MSLFDLEEKKQGISEKIKNLENQDLVQIPSISNPEELESLYAKFNKLTYINFNFIVRGAKFSKLVEMDFSHNKIKGFSKDFYHIFPNLRILNLAFNKLRKLPMPFLMLKSLEELNITGNLIESLPHFIPFMNLTALKFEWPLYVLEVKKRLGILSFEETCKDNTVLDLEALGNCIDVKGFVANCEVDFFDYFHSVCTEKFNWEPLCSDMVDFSLKQ